MMSPSIIKALPGKLDIKRQSSSILYLFSIVVGSVLIFVTRKANSEELATNLLSRDFKREYLQQGVQLGDNCIQNFNLGRYIVGYTVGNFTAMHKQSHKHDFQTYIR